MTAAVDTETFRFAPGHMAPRLVCVSVADDGGDAKLYDARDGTAAVHRLLDGDRVVVGHNLAYDVAVLMRADPDLIGPLFAAAAEGRLHDTRLRDKLAHIYRGSHRAVMYSGERAPFSLAAICARRLGAPLEKGEERTTFARLVDLPLEDWPVEHAVYARTDAAATLAVAQAQARDESPDALYTEQTHVRASIALQLASVWGMRTDPARVAPLIARWNEEAEQFRQSLAKHGVYRPDGTKNTKALQTLVAQAFMALGQVVPYTATGKVAIDKTTLLDSGDELLAAIAEGGKSGSMLSKFAETLDEGTRRPITCRYEALVESGRTSSSGPNIQQIPRDGGLRECFVPRPGYLYVEADYKTLELCTFGQTCLDVIGHSAIAEAINEGRDLHVQLGTYLFGETVDYAALAELVKSAKKKDASEKTERERRAENARQLAKIGNFGFPGGMGDATIADFAKASYGVRLDEAQCAELAQAWRAATPEAAEFFAYVQRAIEIDGYIIYPRQRYVRADVTFTSACNSLFQGPAAFGAKEALFEVARRCYAEPESDLYGSRPVNFVHDSILLESPADKADAAKTELSAVMVDVMRRVACPDVAIGVDATIKERWGSGK